MPYPLRHNDGTRICFITSRCFQARHLLRPGPEVNEIIGSVLARAQALYPEVTLYAFMAMSNHIHALAQAPAEAMAKFFGYVLGQIARRVNKLRGRRGKFWHRRFSCEQIVEDEANFERLEYLFLNPVKAGLCERAEDWVGFSTLPETLGAEPRTYEHVDKTALNRARRSDPEASADEFTEEHTLEVAPLPEFQDDPEGFARQVEGMLERGEEHHRKLREATGESVSSPERIRRLDPESRPEAPKRSPRPLCHAVTQAARKAYRKAYEAFCAAYRIASKAFREGRFDVPFPDHAFRPPVPAGVSAPG